MRLLRYWYEDMMQRKSFTRLSRVPERSLNSL